MAANRFERSAPVQFDLYETPLEPLMMALEAKQRRYDTGYQLAEQLGEVSLDALQQDRPRANELVSGWRNKIDDMVTQYDGDYSRMYKDLGALRTEVRRSLLPGGEGAAIMSNLKSVQDATKEQRERLASGKITQAQYNLWYQNMMSGYTGVGTKDPVLGTYNQITPENIAEYVNPDDALHAALENIAADKGGGEVVRMDGKWVWKHGSKHEVITPERIQDSVQATLMGDQKYLNMMAQQARWMGLDPQTAIQEDINIRAANMANIYRMNNRWTTQDATADRYGLLGATMEAMSPPGGGRTMPGVSQNRKFDRYKLSGPGGYGLSFFSENPAGPPGDSPLTQVVPTLKGQKPVNFDKYYQSAINQPDLPPAIERMYENQRKKVSSEPGFSQLSEREKIAKYRQAVDAVIDRVPVDDATDIVVTGPMMDVIRDEWQAGAGAATYRPIKGDGSLGKVRKQPPSDIVEKPGQYMPYAVGVVDGRIGYKVADSQGNQYLVENTSVSDKANELLHPVAAIQNVYRTGKPAEKVQFGMPIPGPNGEVVGVIPAMMDIDIDDELNTSATLTYLDPNDPQKTLTEKLSAEEMSKLQTILELNAANNLGRNIGQSTQYLNYGDSKQKFDFLNIFGGLQ